MTNVQHLVSVLGQLRLGLLVDLGALLSLGKVSPCSLLALVVCGTLDFPPLLKSVTRSVGFEISHQQGH